MTIAMRRNRPCNVPFRRSPYFSGREQELRDVRELLKGTETVGVVACVEGLAGIGKTELALQLVERLAVEGEYPGGLFWFNAEQPDLTSTWGGVIADELGLPSMPIAERAIAAVEHLRQLQAPVLLVLDNVERWKVGHQPHPLPTGPHIKTLVTTRHKKLGGLQFQSYPLHFLPEPAARELLRRLAGESIEQQPGFAALIEHLGGHALALELAGAYLAEGVFSPREYLERLHRGVPLPADIPEQTRYQRTLDEALDLSWARLSEKARAAWTIAAQFEPAPATIALLRTCGVDEEAMRELSRLHLIEANGTTWEMHRLTRAYGRRKGARTEARLCFLLGCAAHAAAIDTQLGFKIYLADRPHLDEAIFQAPEVLTRHPARFSSLLNGIGIARRSLGGYQEAQELLERALESDLNHLGEEHASTAMSRSNLALVLQDLGDLEGARNLLQQALASTLKQFGEDHAHIAANRSNLAMVLQALGDLEGARNLLQKTLASTLKQFGEDHPHVAANRSNLALVLQDLGDREGAKDLLQKALASTLKQFGEDHPHVAANRSNLALVLKELGDLEGAKDLLQKALAFDLKQFGEDHPSVARCRSNLAGVLQDLGDFARARELLQKALVSDLKQFGEDHPGVATSRSNLAGVLQDLGDLEGARELLQKALVSDLKRFGEDHPEVATSRSNLAMVLKDLGDLEGARELLRKALASALKQFGEDHPSIATRRSNLAMVLKDLGDLEGAKGLLQQALASDLKQFGENHPSVAVRRSNLAVVLVDMRDKEGAQVQIRAALKCIAHLPPGSRVRSHVEHLATQLLSESPLPHPAAPANVSTSTPSVAQSSATAIRPAEAVLADTGLKVAMPPLSQELIDRIEPLREALHAGHNAVLPLVGSGLSQGLPSWTGLLDALIRDAGPYRDELEKALKDRRYLEVASMLESHPDVGRARITSAIQARYQRPKVRAPGVYDRLAALPVDHFATTNYDPWMKDAVSRRVGHAPRVYVPTDVGAFMDIAPGSSPLVLMLHGDADRPETCVLSREGYRHLNHLPAYRQGLAALLSQRRVLVVGHSLTDPDLVDLFELWAEIGSQGGGGAPRHFYLGVGLGQLDRTSLRNKGLEPIDYGDYALLPDVLAHLATAPGVALPELLRADGS